MLESKVLLKCFGMNSLVNKVLPLRDKATPGHLKGKFPVNLVIAFCKNQGVYRLKGPQGQTYTHTTHHNTHNNTHTIPYVTYTNTLSHTHTP